MNALDDFGGVLITPRLKIAELLSYPMENAAFSLLIIYYGVSKNQQGEEKEKG